jgi:H+-transporting ATPase
MGDPPQRLPGPPQVADGPVATLAADQAEKLSTQEALRLLSSDAGGLTSREASARLARVGPNALEERRVSPVLEFLSYYWGPIPWMIEVAAVLSGVLRHWADLTIILVLLVFNAAVGFWQEHQAAGAIDALKRQLALKARVSRDGHWQQIDAVELVPGDVVRLRLGDVIPADVKLVEGEYLSVDQSALTGESLPVDKRGGDVAYSSSVVKQGEMVALVVATGAHTFFGATARLVSVAGAASHFQKAVLTIGDYLIYLSMFLVAVLVAVQLLRGNSFLTLVQFALILTVAAIPVAMPAVLSVTMAVGASALSKLRAIVSRLESIEEMAGIDVLCSDKTGTLTQNKLTLGEPAVAAEGAAQELVLAAALASKEEDRDPIDMAVIAALQDASRLQRFTQTAFVPFDPVRKRTEAQVRADDGEAFTVTKGAPQVILDLCRLGEEDKRKAEAQVDQFARRGYRTLGAARRDDGGWRFLGLLPLFDPPREDSADTIARAQEHGIEVKMVTGDDVAIAREIAGRVGLGAGIVAAGEVFAQGEQDAKTQISPAVAERIEQADGFARVFPEHKYDIVRALQERGHIVGMTGDGVNDAPALKQADVGVAVDGATDAARAAADLVLTAPGLGVIVRAVEQARRIFERMTSYAIYRITETIRIMFFVVLSMIAFNFYPITAIMIILLALLNDVPIMTIAWDNTWLDPKPVRWDMRRVLTISTLLGLTGVISTMLLLAIARVGLKFDVEQIQTLVFLKLTVAGHLTLFIARTRKPFYSSPYPAPIMIWSAVATKVLATLVAGFGFGLITPIPWWAVGMAWGYAIAWMLLLDFVKVEAYRHLSLSAGRHRRFVDRLQARLHSAAAR